MRNLIDNTTLHCIDRILYDEEYKKVITIDDFVTLLHFAEHIMFSDKMFVSTFAIESVRGPTERIYNELLKKDVIKLNNEQSLLLEQKNFTEDQYREACIEAAKQIKFVLLHYLMKSNFELVKLASLCSKSSRVTEIQPNKKESKSPPPPPILKWLEEDFSEQERKDIKDESLERKAKGAYDFIICYDEMIYKRLKEISLMLNTDDDRRKVSSLIGVIFRMCINEELSITIHKESLQEKILNENELKFSFYSPAPTRFNAFQEINKNFRYDYQKKFQKDSPADFMLKDIFIEPKTFPIPVFAIYHIREAYKNNPGLSRGPFKCLEIARELRDNPMIEKYRNWFNKWQGLIDSNDKEEKNKADIKLKEFDKQLSEINENKLLDIGTAAISSLVFSGIGESVAAVLNTKKIIELLRDAPFIFERRSYVSSIKKDMNFQKGIIREICEIIGRDLILK